MFSFKRFKVEDDRSSMKVGTDGVLLGAWASLDGKERRILDIGCGSGLIALMMAQRSEMSMVDGVDIEFGSAEQAAHNFAMSEWGDRLEAIHVDIRSFDPGHRYDLIISNPPFFVDSLSSSDAGRTIARHAVELSFRELAESVKRLLKPSGRFALILPPNESFMFDSEVMGSLTLVRRCAIYGRVDLPVKRYMSEYVLGEEHGGVEAQSIVIEGDRRGDYTDEYRALTCDFYLKF